MVTSYKINNITCQVSHQIMDVNNNMLRLIDPDNERALGESFIHLLASPSLLALLYQ